MTAVLYPGTERGIEIGHVARVLDDRYGWLVCQVEDVDPEGILLVLASRAMAATTVDVDVSELPGHIEWLADSLDDYERSEIESTVRDRLTRHPKLRPLATDPSVVRFIADLVEAER